MMKVVIASFCGLSAMTAVAAADSMIEPGEWKVTSTTVINGSGSPPQTKNRCVTPEQAANIAGTFGPVAGTINSTCEDPAIETRERSLKWRLQCHGQLDIDVSGDFNFDTPRHYTAIIASKSRMAGALVGDIKSDVEAERVGECTQ
jgi:hypothetical protein